MGTTTKRIISFYLINPAVQSGLKQGWTVQNITSFESKLTTCLIKTERWQIAALQVQMPKKKDKGLNLIKKGNLFFLCTDVLMLQNYSVICK